METTILLTLHHKNVAKSKPYNTLGREIIAKRANWDSSFNENGGFSYFSLYWDWLEDALGRCKHLLDVIHLYNTVFTSLFTYDFVENLMKVFYECWSPSTNTLYTLVGEISITPWDLSILGGLPCIGAFYDKVVPNAQELDGTNDQG